jgi:drug/metabolite transporter (DMT)-like permease
MIKNNAKLYLAVIMLFSTAIASIGQLMFKLGLTQPSLPYMLAYIVIGIAAYGISTVAYFYTLGRSHLSWGYGFVGLSYVFTTILAYTVIAESVSPFKIAGVAAILFGTILIGIS